jgi:hypothetical protein
MLAALARGQDVERKQFAAISAETACAQAFSCVLHLILDFTLPIDLIWI